MAICHHDNILQHGADDWRVIDPQGVIGPAFMESACFIRNHFEDYSGADYDNAVDYMAQRLGESKYTISSAAFVMQVLSTCWGYEMGYTDEEIGQGVVGCKALLDYVQRI